MHDISHIEAPLNACDSHIHIYDTTTPLVPWTTTPGPAWATVSGYRDVQKRLGLTRAVVVQANAYGTDNTCTVNAIAELGLDKARGVATVDADVTDAELKRLDEAGIRGARVHLLSGGFLTFEKLELIAAKIAKFDWHIVLQMDGRFLHEREAMLRNLPCTLVIDHIGKFLEPATVEHEGFRALLRLLSNDRTWLKLCGPYEVSKSGGPHYADTSALAKAAAAHKPDRMVWASNWPHVWVKELPDDQLVLDILQEWIPDEKLRNMALVDNPAMLYRF
jgi:D-galactarolactone isomerase